MWIERILSESLVEAAHQRPAVLVTGARQTGKSSLLRHTFRQYPYVTLDAPIEATQAQENPSAFLERHGEPLIIDEVQYAPELFREIKIRIDSDRQKTGRFLLTGSQTFPVMSGVRESLAGRVRLLHLGTLSAQELREDRRFERERIDLLPGTGGFPELWANDALNVSDYYEDYVGTYLERDLRRIVAVREIAQFRRFLGLLAARTGNLLNYTDLARSVGVTANTIKDWIAALEASGLIVLLPPWFENLNKRLTKSPKIYFGDTGLGLYLNGLGADQRLPTLPIWGAIWENFVIMEMIKTMHLTPGRTIFFYRDHSGVEVDAIIRGEPVGIHAAGLTLVEIKGSPMTAPKTTNLNKVRAELNAEEARSLIASPIGKPDPIILHDHTIFDPRYSAVDVKSVRHG